MMRWLAVIGLVGCGSAAPVVEERDVPADAPPVEPVATSTPALAPHPYGRHDDVRRRCVDAVRLPGDGDEWAVWVQWSESDRATSVYYYCPEPDRAACVDALRDVRVSCTVDVPRACWPCTSDVRRWPA